MPPCLCLVVGLVSFLAAGDPVDTRLDDAVVRRLTEASSAKVWVFLEDKGLASPASRRAALSDARQALPARTLARRSLRRSAPGLVDRRDVPVAPAYLARLRALGVRPRVTSRWLNAVSAEVDRDLLGRVVELPFVRRVSLVSRSVPLSAAAAAPAPAPLLGGPSFYGNSFGQLDLLALPALHDLGHTGAGVIVAVLDTGFALTHDVFTSFGQPLDVLESYDFVDDDDEVGPEPGDPSSQHAHGTNVLSVVAGYDPGAFVGAAYDATYILCKTEDTTQEVPAEEDNYVAGLEFAEFHGADVVTSSLGYDDWYAQTDLDGQTPVTTQAVNVATANGVHFVTAAGNNSHDGDPATSHLIAPADALDGITVGAVDDAGSSASFTSDGPSSDGRVKPEVLAQGRSVIAASAFDDGGHVFVDGTSLATPLVAGVVACLVGAHPEWTVAQMRAHLLLGADAGATPVPDPEFVRGYGIVDAVAALDATLGAWDDLGGGSSGVSGVPGLQGSGALVGAQPFGLALTAGPSNELVLLWIATSSAPLAVFGGTLHAFPFTAQVLLVTDGAGSLAAQTYWPAAVPTGSQVWFQYLLQDLTVPGGISLSNAVRATAP